jgi:hypothetical protein
MGWRAGGQQLTESPCCVRVHCWLLLPLQPQRSNGAQCLRTCQMSLPAAEQQHLAPLLLRASAASLAAKGNVWESHC